MGDNRVQDVDFLDHLVYQSKSLIQPCCVRRRRCWHWCWRRLCTPLLATVLNIQTSYLVQGHRRSVLSSKIAGIPS